MPKDRSPALENEGEIKLYFRDTYSGTPCMKFDYPFSKTRNTFEVHKCRLEEEQLYHGGPQTLKFHCHYLLQA